MSPVGYREALARLELLERLAAYDPHVAGTPPLGLNIDTSDIDVLCHAPDAESFAEVVWKLFAAEDAFRMQQWVGDARPVVAAFRAHGWQIEIFGHPRPVCEQPGWRHFVVERRLLDLGGETFRAAVMVHRARGRKTEPAFAAALGLEDDPYAALLKLADRPDADLKTLLAQIGFPGVDAK